MLLSNLVAAFISGWALSLPAPAAAPFESVYTDLTSANCKTVRANRESGFSVKRCPGVAGYGLLLEDDDARQSVTVLAPGGRRHSLNYWQVITTAFSTVGDKAEWRVERRRGKVRPFALIVRVYANENPEAPDERTSYLAVAKITAGKVCVTERVKGGAAANEEARRAADASAGKPCLGWEQN